MSDLLKVGIIGTGFGIRTQHPVFSAHPNAEVIIICGQNGRKTEQIASHYGIPHFTDDYKQLCKFDELDLICVATPPFLHKEMVLTALEENKHILCEKPIAMNIEDAQQILSTSEKYKGKYLINNQLRHHRDLRKVKRFLHSGKIGLPYLARINQVSNDFFDVQEETKWWFNKDMGGGLLLAIAPHLIDLARFWFGRCVEINANLEFFPNLRLANGLYRQIEVEAAFSSTLKMASGLTVLINSTAIGFSPKKELEIQIYGTDGEIHFNSTSGITLYHKDGFQSSFTPEIDQREPPNEPFFKTAFKDFVDVLVPSLLSNYNSVPLSATFEDGLHSLIAIEAIRISDARGERINIDEFLSSKSSPPPSQIQLSLPFPISPDDEIQKPKDSEQFNVALGRAMVSLGPYSKLRHCPYSCAFCYVPGGFSKYPKMSTDQLVAQLSWLRNYENFDRVYISGDTDSFAKGREGIALLAALTDLEIDILFTTRAVFKSQDILRIKQVVEKQRRLNLFVFGCISICTLSNHNFLEKSAPSPKKRIKTLRMLYEAGCITILALRPFLPIIPIDEYLEIIDLCKPFVYCVLGETWFVDMEGKIESKVLGPHKRLADKECEKIKMDFDFNPFTWKEWKAESVKEAVKKHCKKLELPFYMRSHPAIEHLRTKLLDQLTHTNS